MAKFSAMSQYIHTYPDDISQNTLIFGQFSNTFLTSYAIRSAITAITELLVNNIAVGIRNMSYNVKYCENRCAYATHPSLDSSKTADDDKLLLLPLPCTSQTDAN